MDTTAGGIMRISRRINDLLVRGKFVHRSQRGIRAPATNSSTAQSMCQSASLISAGSRSQRHQQCPAAAVSEFPMAVAVICSTSSTARSRGRRRPAAKAEA